MDDRTRAYLRGRFRDYYRKLDLPLPPAPARREWGYIPWTSGGTTMVRHKALYELGDLPGFLARRRPRHVYFSAGRYRDPGAGTMGAKGWEGSDLIFDLDADHLPTVRPDEDGYAEMLAACKDELWGLLDFLRDDFGFEDPTVVFSGGRGYHVHVRDVSVRSLDRAARRQVVDYVRGVDVEFDGLVRTEAVAGSYGRSTPAAKRSLPTDGGWGRRVHRRLLDFLEDLRSLPEEEAMDRLQSFPRIGEDRALKVLAAARENVEAIESGTVDVNDGVLELSKHLVSETVERESAAIDEPVTTDIHRLIRLPGSLHGGTGLRVTPIDPDDLDAFDPLVDAIPALFAEGEVEVRLTGDRPDRLLADLGASSGSGEDVVTLPEHAGLFLLASGRAEKAR